jgi:hypothetical protein
MRGLILGWRGLMRQVMPEADVYIASDGKGGFILSNVHRPGRHYERVISESTADGGPVNAQMVTGRPYADLVGRRPGQRCAARRCCMR